MATHSIILAENPRDRRAFLRPPKVPRQAGFPRGEHRVSRNHFIGAPSLLLIATGESITLRGLEGVPGLPGAPQDEAGLTKKFETSLVAQWLRIHPPMQ